MSQFFGGVVLGIIFTMAMAALPSSAVSIYNDAKETCELELPRNQHCEILFLPKQTGE